MPTETDTQQLVRTELYRPRITAELVPRLRLLRRLEERRKRPLTLFSARAARDEITLVGNWLETRERPSGSVPPDRGDDDRVSPLCVPAACRTWSPPPSMTASNQPTLKQPKKEI